LREQTLQAIRDGVLPPAPIGKLMQFDIRGIEEGRVEFGCVLDESAYNPIGVVHGGLVCTLLDTVAGCAVHTTLPAGASYTTLTLEAKFVRPITRDTGTVRAEAEVVHRGRKQATVEARLIAEGSGKLLAHGTSTCMIMEAQPG
jgi:uncharacterized protein (TIGR00369 family)